MSVSSSTKETKTRFIPQFEKTATEPVFSMAQLQGMFEESHDAVAWLENCRFRWANQACLEMLNLAGFDQLLGYSILDFVKAQDQPLVSAHISQSSIKPGKIPEITFHSIKKGQPGPYLMLSMFPINPGSTHGGLMVTIKELSLRTGRAQAPAKMKNLAANIINAQEEERKKVAKELHDEMGQSVAAIKFSLEDIQQSFGTLDTDLEQRLARVKNLLAETAAGLNRLSMALHPAILYDLGLVPAVASYLENFESRFNIKVKFKHAGFDTRLAPEKEIVIYRVITEALTNSAKHAKADYVEVSLVKGFPNVIAVVEDDGVGFEVDHEDRNGGFETGFGLLGMKERIEMVGGSARLKSSPTSGTKLRFEIPVD